MPPVIPDNQFLFLAEAVAWRYRSCGQFVFRFVRGKLRQDPVYRELLNLPLWHQPGTIVDLGCGQGIFLAALNSARSLGLLEGGKSLKQHLLGMELNSSAAARAAKALGADASITTADLRTAPVPTCRMALLIDVLYHLEPGEQDAVLAKVVDALEPGGALLLREADAAAGWRYAMTWMAEGVLRLSRGMSRSSRHYRSASAWRETLERLGLAVESHAMSAGTPFANVLFVGRKPLS